VDRLETLKAGKAKKVTKKEREEIEDSWRKWKAVTVKRESISREMWSMIADALPDAEKKAETREALGLDD
jgi:26S proteasome regulatory subunit (ATPase 3-interacting protein)